MSHFSYFTESAANNPFGCPCCSSSDESDESSSFSLDNVKVLTYLDAPFRRMPESLKGKHPNWITFDFGDVTLVINNVFTHPGSDPSKPRTVFRLATHDEISSKTSEDITKIWFEGPNFIKHYVPVTRIADITIHCDLKWLQITGLPTVLIYSP